MRYTGDIWEIYGDIREIYGRYSAASTSGSRSAASASAGA